ncbi:M23 family metallopeptidase [Aurantiacibacter gangjinensis]|uniref:Membrane protein n=1 Tax=Aurantiacibacter gangjinensis TaxID=502682 RepID=A0A0G9MQ66_9SPHN|nr:M23 family metallopeptidase [Aurantiacibacter gangjinensis]APE27357.1 Peptidase, M23/M37 family [Aurantiacibacter gangjinensis]KLE31448.1 membrane protein [Aurantiacibacter gangjinensis]
MLLKFASFIAVGSMAIASPALADETEIADGVIDLTAVAEAPADAANADAEEFNELFASWESLEQGARVTATGDITAAPRTAYSVPSRMPVNEYRMSSAYGMRNHPVLRQRRAHNGVDLAAPTGTPVYATADGVVESARYFGSYGNYVQIGHMGDLETRYAHLSRYTVRAGDQVRKGDLIGYVGSTGRSTGPHLHYEVRVAGEPVNPIPYMLADLEAEAANGERLGRGGGPEE